MLTSYFKYMKRTNFGREAEYIFTAIALISPQILFAQATTLKGFATVVVQVLNGLAGTIFVSLIVGMTYGVILYMANSDNETKREEIRGYLMWGVIGISVVVGLWGILALLSATLGWGGVGIPIIRPPA